MESVETFTCGLYSCRYAFPHAICMSLICGEVTGRLTGDNDDSELTTFLQKFTGSKAPNINLTAVFV